MLTATHLRGLAVWACAGTLFVECKSIPGPCDEPGSCKDGVLTDGGPDSTNPKDGSADVVLPAGCQPGDDPKTNAACVVTGGGVFVSTGGDDSADGSKEHPVKTFAEAVKKLGARTRIFACDGEYKEAVTLTGSVSLYGGFACAGWAPSTGRAKIAPPNVGIALSLTNATGDIVLSDLDVTALDGKAPGESSVAMLLAGSATVTVRRATVTAGMGIVGMAGESRVDFTSDGPPGTAGGAFVMGLGAATPNPLCPTSVGGVGGLSNNGPDKGGDGLVAPTEVFPNGATGKGGSTGAQCATGGAGLNGSYGPGGGEGVGASVLGVVAATGWRAADGSDGGRGIDGQGGGGGARLSGAVVGGAGSPGGCGGAGGGKGQGGGGSIAIAVLDARVVVEGASLNASAGGNGGAGGKGQKAQRSGLKGTSDGTNACDGGIGGAGGSGGGGGGGAGGLSVGILYKGAAPKIDGSEVASADTHPAVKLGKKGEPGPLGAGGDPAVLSPLSKAGAPGKTGVDGQAKAVLALP